MAAAATRLVAALVSGLLLLSTLTAAPLGWRTDGTGAYPGARPPTDWSEPNVLWKTKLPGRSFGSPVLDGERIFVVSDPAELLCINRADGKILWRRSHALEDLFGAATAKKVTADFVRLYKERDRLRRELRLAKDDAEKKAELTKQFTSVEADIRALSNQYPVPPALENRGSGNSAATPTTDGKKVYALFGNGIACAYTNAGEKLWARHIERSPIHFGHASSPVLSEGKVLVHLNDLVALDANTGKEVWRVALSARYATPIPMRLGDTAVVVSPAGAVVRVADGSVLLKSGGLQSSECSHILHKDILYTFGGKARALRLLPGEGDTVKLEQLWESRIAGGRRTPSAVLHDGLLYAVTTGGMLDVLDAKTGQSVYQQRLEIGEVYASATAAGTHVFFGGTRGAAVVLRPGREYDEAARNKVEDFGGSPVFSGRRLYLRTQLHLYCIGK